MPQIVRPKELESALAAYWEENFPTGDEVTSGFVNLANFIIYLSACGFDKSSVRKITKCKEHEYDLVMVRPGVDKLIQALTVQAIEASPLERFRLLVNSAIDRVAEIMVNAEKDSDALRAAEIVLERALGKVQQQVEVKADSPLKKLLEKMSERHTIEVSSKEPAQDAELVLDLPAIHVDTSIVDIPVDTPAETKGEEPAPEGPPSD